MKIRSGFVSNSSSSSFMIHLDKLNAKQLFMIQNHAEMGEKMGVGDYYQQWNLTVNEFYVKGETSMDNFNMQDFLKCIGVKSEDIDWN